MPAPPAAPVLRPAPAATVFYQGFWLAEDQHTVLEISRQGDYYRGRCVAPCQHVAAPRQQARLYTYPPQELKPDGDELTGQALALRSGRSCRIRLTMTGPNALEMKVKSLGVVTHTETWLRQPTAQ